MIDETSMIGREPLAGTSVDERALVVRPPRPLGRVVRAALVGFVVGVALPPRLHLAVGGALLRIGITRYFRRSKRSARQTSSHRGPREEWRQ